MDIIKLLDPTKPPLPSRGASPRYKFLLYHDALLDKYLTLRWAGPYPRTLSVGVDPDIPPIWLAATKNAAAQWSAASRGALVLNVASSSAGDIVVALDGTNTECPPGNLGIMELRKGDDDYLHWTGIWANTANFIWHGGFPFGFQPPNSCSADSILLHEMGHALGLDHSEVLLCIMHYAIWGFDQLQPDDVAGIRALYPYNPPDPKRKPVPRPKYPNWPSRFNVENRESSPPPGNETPSIVIPSKGEMPGGEPAKTRPSLKRKPRERQCLLVSSSGRRSCGPGSRTDRTCGNRTCGWRPQGKATGLAKLDITSCA